MHQLDPSEALETDLHSVTWLKVGKSEEWPDKDMEDEADVTERRK